LIASGFAEDGNLVGWGGNNFGQIGSNDGASTLEPSPINTTGVDMTSGWSKIYCGTAHTIGITDNGGVYGWGSNFNGELAIDESSLASVHYPIPLNFSGSDLGGKSIETFSLGYLFSVALTTDGEVACWGKGGSGQVCQLISIRKMSE
jgi:alpha-tubulin suppressor-like RCC1 family protein